MTRDELAHVLRAAATVVDDGDIVVIGSQSILGGWDAHELPEEATMSVEADIAFRNDPAEEKADLVDGAIGLESPFHETFGYYGQGVSLATACLPDGWEQRLVPFIRADAEPAAGKCLDAHDLVVAKLVAGREKDISFAIALLSAGFVDAAVLTERAGTIPEPEAVRARVRASIARCARRATDP